MFACISLAVYVSPVSVFSALALAAECSAGDTQAELLSALGTDYNKLSANYLSLYRSVFKESETALATMSNSLWLDSSVQADGKRTDALAEKYGSYSYSADFIMPAGMIIVCPPMVLGVIVMPGKNG